MTYAITNLYKVCERVGLKLKAQLIIGHYNKDIHSEYALRGFINNYPQSEKERILVLLSELLRNEVSKCFNVTNDGTIERDLQGDDF